MKKIFTIPLLLLGLVLFSCQEKKSDIAQKKGIYEVAQQSSCVGCHTNQALLEQVAEPLENGAGEAGEG